MLSVIFKVLYAVYVLGCLGLVVSKILPEVKTHWIHNEKSKTSMPDVIQFKLYLDGEDVPMNLVQQSAGIANSSMIITQLKGEMLEWKLSENEMSATYKDTGAAGALFTVVTKHVGGIKEISYMAKFSFGKNFYTLVPEAFNISYKTDITARANTKSIVLDGTLHSIAEYKGLISPGQNCTEKNLECSKKMTRMKRSNEERSNKTLVTMEVFVVIDYSIYNQYFLKTKASSEQESRKDTITTIVYIFSHIMNSVKSLYEEVEDDTMKFTTRVAGIFIAERQEDAPFIENAKDVSSRIDSESALDNIKKWADDLRINKDSKTFKLPNFDVIAAFTSYPLYRGQRMIQGIANTGSVCSYSAIALIAYPDYFETISTATHELGHTLGSTHDGNGNNCNPNKYIMSPSATDVAQFSSCSVQRFKNKMKGLSDSNKNCLLDNKHPDEKNPLLDFYPGQIYDLDTQCKTSIGSNYFFYEGIEPYQNLCQKLYCRNDENDIRTYKALDGTSCSNGAWCYRDNCVRDKRAPKTSDHCINGDSKTTILINSQKMSCKDLVDKNPDACRNQKVKSRCCASCTGNRKSDGGGCQDTISECHELQPRDCYNDFFATTCCRTCKSLIQNSSDVDCLYGDKGVDCSTMVPDVCHLHTPYCCQSCARFKEAGITTKLPVTTMSTTKNEPVPAVSTTKKVPTPMTSTTKNGPVPAIIPTTSTNNSCIDFHGILEYTFAWGGSMLFTCKELIENENDLCEDEDVHKYCCASCKVIKDECIEDFVGSLMYQSKAFKCNELVHLNPHLCYHLDFQMVCCDSCRHTGIIQAI